MLNKLKLGTRIAGGDKAIGADGERRFNSNRKEQRNASNVQNGLLIAGTLPVLNVEVAKFHQRRTSHHKVHTFAIDGHERDEIQSCFAPSNNPTPQVR